MSDTKNLSSTERIKQKSDGLRGTLAEGLVDELTGAISEDDQALVKFHGMYLQDDRDRREELGQTREKWDAGEVAEDGGCGASAHEDGEGDGARSGGGAGERGRGR